MTRSIYLGDGAYATLSDDDFRKLVLTTGNHNPALAGNVVWLGRDELEKLLAFLENPELGDETP